MSRYQELGKGFKTVTCAQTGEEVTRRKSLAINYKGDGTSTGRTANDREITAKSPCQRVVRRLVKDAPISHVEAKIEKIIEKRFEKEDKKKVNKVLTTKEKAFLRKKLHPKNET